MESLRLENVTVTVKMWLDKTPGNTYHSVKICHDERLLAQCDFSYGYGEQYKVTALELLKKKGLFVNVDLTQFSRVVTFKVSDVTYRKQLYNEIEVTELVLYTLNDGELYRNYEKPYFDNLIKKYRKGTYQHDRSLPLFRRLANKAAKKYCKEFCSDHTKWNQL